ncbi:hypothetical protein BDV06DRAFT_184326 [Aspergillus oleicola]
MLLRYLPTTFLVFLAFSGKYIFSGCYSAAFCSTTKLLAMCQITMWTTNLIPN